jgi:RecB family exonuclease
MNSVEEAARNFMNSDLEKRREAAEKAGRFCKSEYAIITAVKTEYPVFYEAEADAKTQKPEMREKIVTINGRIDLLFDDGEHIVIVDYKTDQVEQPEIHYEQLAAYKQAAGDIFEGKPVETWLFYLRSGRAVDISKETEALLANGGLSDCAAYHLALTAGNRVEQNAPSPRAGSDVAHQAGISPINMIY